MAREVQAPERDEDPSLAALARASETYRAVAVVRQVAFATSDAEIETLEGPVRCAAGDAIVTGEQGERWPVPRAHFDALYDPVGAAARGQPGPYRKKPIWVRAAQLQHPLKVELDGGRGALEGAVKSWCVWQSERQIAVVQDDIFRATHERVATQVPVYYELGPSVDGQSRLEVAAALEALSSLLPHTRFLLHDGAPAEGTRTEGTRTEGPHKSIWFSVGPVHPPADSKLDEPPKVSVRQLIQADGPHSLVNAIRAARMRRTWHGALLHWLRDVFMKRHHGRHAGLEILACQLLQVDRLNGALRQAPKQRQGREAAHYIEACPSLQTSARAAAILEIGDLADHQAGPHQEQWQRLVIGTTKELAQLWPHKHATAKAKWILLMAARLTLFGLGVLAATALVSFTELSDGCEAHDPFSFLGCDGAAWKRWFGPSSFAAYLVLFGTAWLLHRRAKLRGIEASHQDFRLLAECLRVQYVLEGLRFHKCVAGDLPLAHNDESGWVRLALESLHRHYPAPAQESPASAVHPSDLEWARRAFVEAQIKYHKSTLLKRREQALKNLQLRSRCFGIGIFAVIFILAAHMAMVTWQQWHGSPGSETDFGFLSPMGRHFLLILQVVFLAIWSGIGRVSDTFGLEQELRRGQLVQHRLEGVKRNEQENGNDPQIQRECIREAGRYFARDQAAWHMLHRSKPIEAPGP